MINLVIGFIPVNFLTSCPFGELSAALLKSDIVIGEYAFTIFLG
jgi:hypothetical protein